MEFDLNFDSKMDMNMDTNMHPNMDTNMDSNANSSARFLVQFLPENPPYCEHDAYAEHHGNVADLDIETANPYFVEMDTSLSLPSFPWKRKAPQPTNVSSNPPPGPAPLNEDKESSPAGPAQEALGPEDLKKKTQNDRRAARKLQETIEREERVKKANRALEKKQRSTEAYLEQEQQAKMQNDGSERRASNFRSDRKKVKVNPITTLNKRSSSRKRL
jgi:hypothetical protein